MPIAREKDAIQTFLASCANPIDRAKMLKVLVWAIQGSTDWPTIVIDGLRDPAKEVQIAIARMVGRCDPPAGPLLKQVIEQLRKSLGDSDPEVIRAAREGMIRSSLFEETDIPLLLEGFAQLGYHAELPDLRTLVVDIAQVARRAHQPEVMTEVGAHLRKILVSEVPFDEHPWYWQRDILADVFTEKLSESILPLFGSHEPRTRLRAAIAYKWLQRKQHRLPAQFLELLNDSDPKVREVAITLLNRNDLSKSELIGILIDAINGADSLVRNAAIRAFREGPMTAEVVDAILRVVKEGDEISEFSVVSVFNTVKEPELRQKIIDEIGSTVAKAQDNKIAHSVLWNLLVSRNVL